MSAGLRDARARSAGGGQGRDLSHRWQAHLPLRLLGPPTTAAFPTVASVLRRAAASTPPPAAAPPGGRSPRKSPGREDSLLERTVGTTEPGAPAEGAPGGAGQAQPQLVPELERAPGRVPVRAGPDEPAPVSPARPAGPPSQRPPSPRRPSQRPPSPRCPRRGRHRRGRHRRSCHLRRCRRPSSPRRPCHRRSCPRRSCRHRPCHRRSCPRRRCHRRSWHRPSLDFHGPMRRSTGASVKLGSDRPRPSPVPRCSQVRTSRSGRRSSSARWRPSSRH